MKVLDTTEIPLFPSDVHIAWSTISDRYEDERTFVNDSVLEKLSNEQRRNEYLTSRAVFAFLVQFMGWTGNEIELKKEDLGKPFCTVNGDKHYVSFTHSKEMIMCAVSETLDVGLDAENLDREMNTRIVQRILSEKEQENFSNEKPIKLWTLKEAAVKSLGTGLRTNLKDLELIVQNNGSFEILIKHNRLKALSFEVLNHSVALAYS